MILQINSQVGDEEKIAFIEDAAYFEINKKGEFHPASVTFVTRTGDGQKVSYYVSNVTLVSAQNYKDDTLYSWFQK